MLVRSSYRYTSADSQHAPSIWGFLSRLLLNRTVYQVSQSACGSNKFEARTGVAPVYAVLQTAALLLGHRANPFDAALWREALTPHLEAADPRIQGRVRAARWSSDAMAARVLDAWGELAASPPPHGR